jgi:phosphoketolase
VSAGRRIAIDPVSDGVVLPILHLNGYEISNPTVLARITHEELDHLLRGYGWTPYFVEGDEPEKMNQTMAFTLDRGGAATPADTAQRPQTRRHDASALTDDRPLVSSRMEVVMTRCPA